MTMITPSYLGETIEYSSLHACRSTLEDPTPHPPLRPLRRNGSSPQHRARPTIARRARGLARALAQRGGQRGRKTFALASMSGLRRPDDHRRNIRRRAFFALAVAEPDQDRHLMTVAALPATQRLSVSPPATRRSGPPLSSHRPQTLSRRRAHARPSYARDRTRSSPTCPSIRMAASGPRNRTRDPSATFKSP